MVKAALVQLPESWVAGISTVAGPAATVVEVGEPPVPEVVAVEPPAAVVDVDPAVVVEVELPAAVVDVDPPAAVVVVEPLDDPVAAGRA
jgi:hypothetical protein